MNYNEHRITITNQGLASCDVCNGGEGTLAAECPKEPVGEERQRAILKGELEFVRGKWWVPEKIASREAQEAQEGTTAEGETPSYEELAEMHNALLEDHAGLQAEVTRLRGLVADAASNPDWGDARHDLMEEMDRRPRAFERGDTALTPVEGIGMCRVWVVREGKDEEKLPAPLRTYGVKVMETGKTMVVQERFLFVDRGRGER